MISYDVLEERTEQCASISEHEHACVCAVQAFVTVVGPDEDGEPYTETYWVDIDSTGSFECPWTGNVVAA